MANDPYKINLNSNSNKKPYTPKESEIDPYDCSIYSYFKTLS